MTSRAKLPLRRLVQGFFLSGLQKVFSAVFGLVTVLLLATLLEPDGFGLYSFAFSLATIAALPLSLGLPSLVVREVARAKQRENWKKFNGIQYFAFLATLAGSFFIIPIAGVLGTMFQAWDDARSLLLVALLTMPLVALSSVRAAVLTGLGLVARGQIPDSVVRPVSLILMILAFNSAADLTPFTAMVFNLIAILLSFLAGMKILSNAKKSLPVEPARESDYANWSRALVPLSLVTGLQVLNSQVDILVLGFYEPFNSIGIYRVAASAAGQIIFVTFVMNQVLAPEFVRLYERQRPKEMQELAKRAGALCFLVASVVVLFYWVFGEVLIDILLGPDYAGSYGVLKILSFGYLVYALSSPANTLLTMTGNEKYLAISAALAFLLNLALNFLLVPRFGVHGAAAATVIATIAWRLLLVSIVRRQLRIE